MDLSVGDRVRHPAMPDWGIGEVVEPRDSGKVAIFFEHVGEKVLKGVPLEKATGAELTRPIVVRRAGKSGRRLRARSMQEYVAVFLDEFPQGFREPLYINRERAYKVEASDLLRTELSQHIVQGLIDAREYERVCGLAGKVVNATNVIYPNEKMSLRDGPRSPENAERFATGLYRLLYSTETFESRFAAFVNILSDMGAARWTVATYFPYLAMPTEHMFLKPVPTRRIAEACGVELNYRPEPNWLTYQCLLRLAERLKETLADLEPRDMIDLQGFVWLVARNAA